MYESLGISMDYRLLHIFKNQKFAVNIAHYNSLFVTKSQNLISFTTYQP